ncbi:MAG: hypothetical protein HXL12_02575 [Candidatus Nanosynbacter sp.]|nr:hypothetical protein [Candidatus Nanosynbacter sp.]
MSKKADLEHIRERLAALAGTRTRVILVCNCKSTGHKRVEKEVVKPLREFILRQKGMTFLRFDVESPTLEENAEKLSKLIMSGDVILTAGGDGTAGIGVNGIMQSGKDAKFYVIPYGNFNDIIQILRLNSGKKVYPIEALVDGKHFRYALAYFTVGMMAESTKIFDDEKVRRKLRKSKFNLIFSLKTLLMWFFVNRKKDYITIDGQKYSDILVVNGKNVARLMKGGEYYLGETFLYTEQRLNNFFAMVFFMLQAMFSGIPGKKLKNKRIRFEEKQRIFIQSEGEYKDLVVQEISFSKSDKSIEIL